MKSAAIGKIVYRKERSDENPELPIGVPKIDRKHRFLIYKSDVEKHGATEDCKGCENVLLDRYQRKHTEECRERFEQILSAEGDDRIVREINRLEDQKDERVG